MGAEQLDEARVTFEDRAVQRGPTVLVYMGHYVGPVLAQQRDRRVGRSAISAHFLSRPSCPSVVRTSGRVSGMAGYARLPAGGPGPPNAKRSAIVLPLAHFAAKSPTSAGQLYRGKATSPVR